MVSMHGFWCAQLRKTADAPHTKCRELEGNYARLGFDRGVLFSKKRLFCNMSCDTRDTRPRIDPPLQKAAIQLTMGP